MANKKIKNTKVELTEEQKNTTPIDRFVQAKNVNRFTAAVVDVVLAAITVLVLLVSFVSVLNVTPAYANVVEEKLAIEVASQLRQIDPNTHAISYVDDNRYMGKLYPVKSDEYEFKSTLPRNENAQYSDYRVVQVLAYYYISFLTGENLRENDYMKDENGNVTDELALFEYVASPDADKPMVDANGNKIIGTDGKDVYPRDYYTISWFNQNILEMPVPGEEGDEEIGQDNINELNVLFRYQINPETNTKDYTKIGVPKDILFKKDVPDPTDPNFVEDPDNPIDFSLTSTYFLTAGENRLLSFLDKKYANAQSNLASKDYFIEKTTFINNVTHYFSWGFIALTVLIYYLIIPLCLKKGQTLGRLFFRLGTVDRRSGFRAKKWQTLVRALIPIALVVVGIVAKMDLIPLVSAIAVALIDVAIALLSKGTKLTIPDIISLTTIVELKEMPLYRNDEEEKKAFIKQNVEEVTKKVQPDLGPRFDTRKPHE